MFYDTIANAATIDPNSTAPICPPFSPILVAEFFLPCVGVGDDALSVPEPEPKSDEPEEPEEPETVDLPVMEAFRAADSESNSAKAESALVVCHSSESVPQWSSLRK